MDSAPSTIETILSTEALAAGKELAQKRDAEGNRVYINDEIIKSLNTENRNREHSNIGTAEEWKDAFIAIEIKKEIEKMLRDYPILKSLIREKIAQETNPVKINNIVRMELIKYYEKETVLSNAALAAGKELAQKRDAEGNRVYINDEIKQRLEIAIKNETAKNPNFDITEEQENRFIAEEITKEIKKMLKDSPSLKSLLFDPIINLTDTEKIKILTTELVDRILLEKFKATRLAEQRKKLSS